MSLDISITTDVNVCDGRRRRGGIRLIQRLSLSWRRQGVSLLQQPCEKRIMGIHVRQNV